MIASMTRPSPSLSSLFPVLLAAVTGCGIPDTDIQINFIEVIDTGIGTTNSLTVDGDGDGYIASYDCDDDDASINPGAFEACDGIDNDCDGVIDEESAATVTWYAEPIAGGLTPAVVYVSAVISIGHNAPLYTRDPKLPRRLRRRRRRSEQPHRSLPGSRDRRRARGVRRPDRR